MSDSTVRWIGRLILLSMVALPLAGSTLTGTADAGGSWLYPVAERYAAGEAATMVGYTGGGAYGGIDDGPFFGYLLKPKPNGERVPGTVPLPVGAIDMTVNADTNGSPVRAAITFDIPDWAPPGMYELTYCNAACDEKLGDLIGGYLYVDADPANPIVRSWPASEPEIANLAADALVSSFGSAAPAASVRARTVAAQAEGNLTAAYKRCVRDAGFTEELGAQVLTTDEGRVWHVKTSPEVPADFHGPCLLAIGGPETSGSSWSTGGYCDLPNSARSVCGD